MRHYISLALAITSLVGLLSLSGCKTTTTSVSQKFFDEEIRSVAILPILGMQDAPFSVSHKMIQSISRSIPQASISDWTIPAQQADNPRRLNDDQQYWLYYPEISPEVSRALIKKFGDDNNIDAYLTGRIASSSRSTLSIGSSTRRKLDMTVTYLLVTTRGDNPEVIWSSTAELHCSGNQKVFIEKAQKAFEQLTDELLETMPVKLSGNP